MPGKNVIKNYVEEGYYHIYNRGVNKMNIFKDTQDYRVFLSYMKAYLLPKDSTNLYITLNSKKLSLQEKDKILKIMRLRNYYSKIKLITYCLMSNHFHFIIQQKHRKDLPDFMQSLMTRYAHYFNRKYKRRGPLYEGKYKGVLIQSDKQLWHLSRYVHRNPLGIISDNIVKKKLKKLLLYKPSSYPVYLKTARQSWVKPEVVTDNFSQTGINSYQSFVEEDDSNFKEKHARIV
jgi:putative transposase